jgi:hypothetical protein
VYGPLKHKEEEEEEVREENKRSLPFIKVIRVIACCVFSPILTSDNREFYDIRSKYFSCKLL